MRIVYHELSNIPTGFIKVLQKYDHQMFLWKKDVPAFDIFDRYEPDLLVIPNSYRSKSLDKCIGEIPAEYIKVIYSEDFDFIAFDDTLSCSFPPKPLELVFFGEYNEYLFDFCDKNLLIFNSRGNAVPNEVGSLTLEEAYPFITDKTTMIHVDGYSDPEFTMLGLAKKAKIVGDCNLKLQTYRDKIKKFFEVLELEEEANEIQ